MNATTTDHGSRTQEQRSSATRHQLLQATFECLVELGYARTSTPEVLRRTGISRGALLHHYPTRTDLVVAAVDYVFARQLDAFRHNFKKLPAAEERGEAAVELLWQTMSGDTYYAWLELVVAARTDAVLRAKIHEVNTRFDQDAAGLYEELFPGVEQRPEGGSLSLSFAFATLGGLAVSAIHEDPERVRRIVDVLKRLSAMFDASNKTPGS